MINTSTSVQAFLSFFLITQRRPPPPVPPTGDDDDDYDEDDDDDDDEEVVVALYDFPGAESHDLSLVKGEEYIILEKCDVNWYKACNQYGWVCLSPCTFVSTIHVHHFVPDQNISTSSAG